ncbi:MAG TPA: hypothetical protein VF534_27475 [Paraburkholderia sp.]
MGFLSLVVNLPSKLFQGVSNTLLAAGTPNQVSSGTLQNINDTVLLATDTLVGIGISLTGTPVGASVIIEATQNGSTWDVLKVYPKIAGSAGTTSPLTTAGDYGVHIGTFKQVRARLSAITSGSFSVTLNGTVAPDHMPVKNGNASDLNATVVFSGSTGIDYSANKPTIPGVGQPFSGAAAPYASYVLLTTIPANPFRANVEILNPSGVQLIAVLDDGTVTAGNPPNNASIVPLGPGSVAGAQGGGWNDQTFKGRVQVYAPATSSTAFVTARAT